MKFDNEMGGSWEARNGQQSGKGCLVARSKNVSDSLPRFAAHLMSKIPPMEFQNLQVCHKAVSKAFLPWARLSLWLI
jgi:hypothetical protein